MLEVRNSKCVRVVDAKTFEPRVGFRIEVTVQSIYDRATEIGHDAVLHEMTTLLKSEIDKLMQYYTDDHIWLSSDTVDV